MPDLQTPALLFLAGCVSWTISTFSGGSGSLILLAVATHLINRSEPDGEPCTYRSLVAAGGMAGGTMVSARRSCGRKTAGS